MGESYSRAVGKATTARVVRPAAEVLGDDRQALPAPDPLILAQDVVYLAAERNAADIMLMDIRKSSGVADYFVICSGQTERQLRAILTIITEGIQEKWGVKPLHSEGTDTMLSGWVVLDYGSVVIHVFSPEERAYYRLERLWAEATTLLRMQ